MSGRQEIKISASSLLERDSEVSKKRPMHTETWNQGLNSYLSWVGSGETTEKSQSQATPKTAGLPLWTHSCNFEGDSECELPCLLSKERRKEELANPAWCFISHPSAPPGCLRVKIRQEIGAWRNPRELENFHTGVF